MTRLTLQEIRERANLAHKGKYLYPDQEIKNSKAALRIICPLHGEFSQDIHNHCKGSGCAACVAPATFEERVEHFNKVHGNKYTYVSRSKVEGKYFIEVVCPVHGNFSQLDLVHARGGGCPACHPKAVRTQTEVWGLCSIAHNNKYTYELNPNYRTQKDELHVVCPDHGRFNQVANLHLKGANCPDCVSNALMPEKELVDRCLAKHEGRFTYLGFAGAWKGAQTLLRWSCPVHGEFKQLGAARLVGKGCAKCHYDSGRNRTTFANWWAKVQTLHAEKYTYPDIAETELEWLGVDRTYVNPVCVRHGEFRVRALVHAEGVGCQKCVQGDTRKWHTNISKYIQNLGFTVTEDRKIPGSNFEIDIYVVEKNLAIELHGIHWHSSQFRPNNYHIEKRKLVEAAGITLVEIFSDEWSDSEAKVLALIRSKLGVATDSVYARNTKMAVLASRTAREFYTKHHLQGFAAGDAHLGLLSDEEVVACMSFIAGDGGRNSGKDSVVLTRFATSKRVVGGASKLLNAFVKMHRPKTVVSFSDNRYSDGNLYRTLGFAKLSVSAPDYRYVVGKRREHKSNYQRKHLPKKLKTFDPLLSEKANCEANDIYAIYDCGLTKWCKILEA